MDPALRVKIRAVLRARLVEMRKKRSSGEMDPNAVLEQKRIRNLIRKNCPYKYLKLKGTRIKPRLDLGPLSRDEARIVEELTAWAKKGRVAPYWTVLDKITAEPRTDEIGNSSSYMRPRERRRELFRAITQLTARGMIARHYATMFLTAPDENSHH
jgi:hypothetical protein